MKISKKNYDNVINYLLQITKNASSEIMKIYNQDFSIQKKSDSSPLTEADTRANEIIVDALKTEFSTVDIISEENKENKLTKENFFLVDPLDGTKEFIKKNGEFTINIAYMEKKEPTLGIICLPVKNLIYFTNGYESFRLTNKGVAKKINATSCFNYKRIVTSRSHLDDKTLIILNNIKNKKVSKKGSSLKFCMIAEGKSDVYFRFGNTMEWDVAAGHAILKNAKSHLTDLNFKKLTYGKKAFINPPFIAFNNLSQESLMEIKNHIKLVKQLEFTK